ncbi:MAG: SIS domain-containing protein [Caldilineaceae bacterium]|nr:SIS domain-containing protein [Caldilineaceae bacterium]
MSYPYIEYTAQVKQTLDRLPWPQFQQMVSLFHLARLESRQIFVLGNGGSAATASHIACDLSKNTRAADKPYLSAPHLKVMSLNDNMSLFSAIANDEGYENVFAHQLENVLQEKDVVLAISASGNSPNVLNAVKLARARNAQTVGWSGYDGGALAHLVDIAIVVPNWCIEQIEDIHMMMGHMLTMTLRQKVREKSHEHPLVSTPA